MIQSQFANLVDALSSVLDVQRIASLGSPELAGGND